MSSENLASKMNLLLISMRLGGLVQKDPPTTADMMAMQAKIYLRLLINKGIEPEWWEPAADYLTDTTKFFPSAGEFAAAAELIRSNATYHAPIGYDAVGRLHIRRVRRDISKNELNEIVISARLELGLRENEPKQLPYRPGGVTPAMVESKMRIPALEMSLDDRQEVEAGLENARRITQSKAQAI